ncbi:sigma-54 interaction domain-containing protein [Helicovermis profundi]|uniref:Sigma-54 factor interaction domain-containing protein n=1 Tax=Helicovermis profundi TaxID=3065157 RepID=A0AAU9E2A5_9FIRM|nr:hypothetical protein HLPR_09750 [Clostridia bacterium S502]
MKYQLLTKDFSEFMNEGLIYIDKNGIIKEYNEKAKELIGIKRSCTRSHSKGKINKNDIVILAYTSFGYDKNGLEEKDLKKIGINLPNLKKGDTLLAYGKYESDEIGKSKVKESDILIDNFIMDAKIDGIKISSKVNYLKRFVEIKVDNEKYRHYYNNFFSHVIILDKDSKEIKFYQDGGYTAWKEDLKQILDGNFYHEKKNGCNEIEVINKHILDIHDKTEIINDLINCSQNEIVGYKGKKSKINGIDALCTLKQVMRGSEIIGAFLLINDISRLRNAEVQKEMVYKKLKLAKEALKNNSEYAKLFPKLIGSSQSLLEVKRLAYKASKFQSNLLILGESGTGKSILARCIHEASANHDMPFIEVNCNSIPESLMESELFGYEKGAFTGANQKGKKGYFEMANGGTLFLDEIGDFPKGMQVKLLHVIQNKKFFKVGGDKEIQVNLRIIVATNRNLEKDVKNGIFREDLYYRINVFPIHLPPLRDRIVDIYELIEFLLPRICNRIGTNQKHISGEAINKIKAYHWPGNIRELENVLERAVNLCEDKTILSEHLKIKITKKNIVNREEYLRPLKETMNSIELEIIENVYNYTNRDKKKTMEILKIKKTKLYEKIKELKNN